MRVHMYQGEIFPRTNIDHEIVVDICGIFFALYNTFVFTLKSVYQLTGLISMLGRPKFS